MKRPFHDRVSQTAPDSMHTIKDVIENIFMLLIGKKDSVKVRKAEISQERFGLVPSEEEQGSTSGRRKQSRRLPEACFRLSSADITIADKRMNEINTPASDFTPRGVFSRPVGLKSHDWKEVNNKFQ